MILNLFIINQAELKSSVNSVIPNGDTPNVLLKQPTKITYFQVYGQNKGRVNTGSSLREDVTTSQKIKLGVSALCIAHPKESNFQQFSFNFFQNPPETFYICFLKIAKIINSSSDAGRIKLQLLLELSQQSSAETI